MNPNNTTQETGQTATYTNRDFTVVISIAQYHFFNKKLSKLDSYYRKALIFDGFIPTF